MQITPNRHRILTIIASTIDGKKPPHSAKTINEQLKSRFNVEVTRAHLYHTLNVLYGFHAICKETRTDELTMETEVAGVKNARKVNRKVEYWSIDKKTLPNFQPMAEDR